MRGNYKLIKPGVRVWENGIVEVRTTITFDPAQDAGLITALEQSAAKTSKLVADLVRLGFNCEPTNDKEEETIEVTPTDWKAPDISIEI